MIDGSGIAVDIRESTKCCGGGGYEKGSKGKDTDEQAVEIFDNSRT
jgi:hypothetical protein